MGMNYSDRSFALKGGNTEGISGKIISSELLRLLPYMMNLKRLDLHLELYSYYKGDFVKEIPKNFRKLQSLALPYTCILNSEWNLTIDLPKLKHLHTLRIDFDLLASNFYQCVVENQCILESSRLLFNQLKLCPSLKSLSAGSTCILLCYTTVRL